MTTIRPASVSSVVSTSSSQPILAEGAQGSSVRSLQSRLRSLGFDPGPLDGQFGPRTEAAVVAFQRAHGLEPDGIVGPLTSAALDGARRSPAPRQPREPRDGFEKPKTPAVPSPSPGGGFAVVPSVSHAAEDAAARAPTSNGVPIYRQGDPAWGGVTMNDDDTLSSAGCALTAVAMAVSAVSGVRVDPSQLDAQLDRTGGYMSGSDGIGNWGLLGETVAPRVSVTREFGLTPSALDAQLASGKPVVIGVDYHGDSGTDHWMTVTGRGSDSKGPYYSVNDPATGEVIKMRVSGSGLVADPSTTDRGYRTTGDFVTVG